MKVQIDVKCVACGTHHIIEVGEGDILKYQEGALIQDAFPYLSASQRELLISKVCGPCFDAIFADDEEI